MIGIHVRRQEDRVVLAVSNPVAGDSRRHQNGNRMAQQNIRQRLLIAYGERAGFDINETKQLYTVTLVIPLVS